MLTSLQCKQRLKAHEGLRQSAYLDNATPPVWTIGYGTTLYPDGSRVKQGDTCTAYQANDWLNWRIEEFEDAVQESVTITINQKMFDALVSMAYNIGSAAIRGSTLVQKLNEYDFIGAQAEFDKWVYSGNPKQVNQGLVNRRNAEQQDFNNGIREALAGNPEVLAEFNRFIDETNIR